MNGLDYNQLAAQYTAHRQVHPGVLQALCAVTRAEHRVLEVGCGTGNYITALATIAGCTGWGIDPSSEMLARARQQLEADPAAPTVCLAVGRGEQLDLPDRQFDLVFSVDVIHHIENRASYLQEAYRVLKPGARLCTATDSEWIIRHREPLATYWPETIDVELARYPRIGRLESQYLEAGFGAHRALVEHRTTINDSAAYRSKAFSALHLISDSAFRTGLNRLESDLRRGPVPLVSRYTLLWGTKPHA